MAAVIYVLKIAYKTDQHGCIYCVSIRKCDYTNMVLVVILEKKDEHEENSINTQGHDKVHQSVVRAARYYACTRKHITTA